MVVPQDYTGLSSMCGLVGEIGAGAHRTIAFAPGIARTLTHRGPNDEGFANGDSWWLGFRRLSILDLKATGHQPMSTADGRYWLVFNGEIYNYKELAAELTARGVVFRGSSDSEVLLYMLSSEGSAALSRLNGMFAFVFVDLVRRRFLLARDRLGVKPLYWIKEYDSIRFASELKALLAWPNSRRVVNREAIREFLSLGYLPTGTSIFSGYKKLPPGCFAEGSLDAPAVEPRTYWSVCLEPRRERLHGHQLEELDALLEDAVRIRMRSDVKLGVFLSGGIDSGLVASYVSRFSKSVLALTVAFEESEFDESLLARKTADTLRLDHEIIPQRLASLDDIDALTRIFDEPFGDPSALPMMLLCSTASNAATVFLTGDGGDEAFGGYRRYIEANRHRWLTKIPQILTRGARTASSLLGVNSRLHYRINKSSMADAGMAAVFDGQGLLLDPALHMILPSDLKAPYGESVEPVATIWNRSRHLDMLTRQRDLDYKLYLPDDVLVKVDRASMAHSIEVRSPFLDYRVVEWAAQLASSDLVEKGFGKVLLRKLAINSLPVEVARVPKSGFGVPLGNWFRSKGGQKLFHERVLDPKAHIDELWDITGAKRLLTLHSNGGRDFGEYLWRLLVLAGWTEQYFPSAVPHVAALPVPA